MSIALDQKSPMPWGKHQGKAIIDVPASYLLYLWDAHKIPKGNVYQYVFENLAHLRKEVEDEKRNKLDQQIKDIE